MKVLFVTNLPSPYRVDFFNQLSSFCELTVVYERHSAEGRDKKWVRDSNGQYKVDYLNSVALGEDKSIGFGLIKYLKRFQFDRIVFCGFSSPTIIIGIVYCRLHRIKYFIESDGGFDNSMQDGYIKGQIKRFLTAKCEGILTTCESDKSAFISLGVDEKKIAKYPFSSITNAETLEYCATDSEKQEIRKELGLKGEKITVSVGRFISVKGFDILIKAAQYVDSNTYIYIIGGVPTDAYIQLSKDKKNVIFLDFMDKNELRRYYLAADLFVLPTRGDVWGLVINEAMACGLPVITTDRCGAGVEMIKDGINGYIVPTDDIRALADAICVCLNNTERLKACSENALLTAKAYTIENMVKSHLDILFNDVEM